MRQHAMGRSRILVAVSHCDENLAKRAAAQRMKSGYAEPSLPTYCNVFSLFFREELCSALQTDAQLRPVATPTNPRTLVAPCAPTACTTDAGSKAESGLCEMPALSAFARLVNAVFFFVYKLWMKRMSPATYLLLHLDFY